MDTWQQTTLQYETLILSHCDKSRPYEVIAQGLYWPRSNSGKSWKVIGSSLSAMVYIS